MSVYERRCASERYLRCGGDVPLSAYERRLRIESQIMQNPPTDWRTIEEYQNNIAKKVHQQEKMEESKERKLIR